MEELNSQKSAQSVLKKLSLEFIVIAVFFVSALFLFALITHEVVYEKEDIFDSRVIHFFSPYSTESFINVMKFFTFFGSSRFLLPAYIVLIAILLIKHKKKYSIHVALIAVTSTALSFGAKRIFHRARPDLPLIQSLKTYSFPSGHALSSFIFCSILVYLLWHTNIQPIWKWCLSVLLFLFSLTIGISRIVLKVHYPSDVLAGFCLGYVWVIFSFYLLQRIESSGRLSNNFPEKNTERAEIR